MKKAVSAKELFASVNVVPKCAMPIITWSLWAWDPVLAIAPGSAAMMMGRGNQMMCVN